MKSDQSEEMELEASIAPPMANGELMFESPWQSRVFGMARVMCEAGHFTWDDFRGSLINRITAWEETHRESDPYAYYEHFLAALTDLLGSKGLCRLDELDRRDAEYQARPHGHDH